MRSESSASPSEDTGIQHRWPRGGVPSNILTDDSIALGLRAFAPEPEHGQLAKGEPAVRQASRFSWRNIALGLLALVAVAQGGLMTYWLISSRPAAPPEIGSVTVTSEPLGSPVLVDGVTRGTTPFVLSLPPGSHRIDVGTGPQLRTQSVNVTRGGDASLHVELRPSPEPGAAALAPGMGGLQIATDPAGARVWIDGKPHGAAPLSVSDLKAGEHAVTVRGAGDPVNRTVTVQAGTVSSLIISMNGAGAFTSGWLAISSGVPVQIMEKGVLLGSTETPRILVSAGSHDLEFTNAALGYRVPRTVQIAAGQTTSIALRTPQGTLHVNALPWAEVWIDGQRAGETPIGNFSLPIGNHELLFRHPELGEQRKTVTVGAVAPLRVGVDLRK